MGIRLSAKRPIRWPGCRVLRFLAQLSSESHDDDGGVERTRQYQAWIKSVNEGRCGEIEN